MLDRACQGHLAFLEHSRVRSFCANIIRRVMNTRGYMVLLLGFALAGNSYCAAKWFRGKSKKSSKQDSAVTVVVDSGLAECKVDVDGEGAGITNAKGILSIEDVEPGDHYVHVQCPEKRDMSYFISPPPGKQLRIEAQASATTSPVGVASPLSRVETDMQLRRMVTQAVQLRADGQFEEAVELLRKATVLDPRNGDLHRELGITFLMFHDWERARVEMLEAIHREPDSVDAHSGLAYALEKLGDLDGSLKQYRICTHLDPDDTTYRDHYVEVLGMLYAQKAQKKR